MKKILIYLGLFLITTNAFAQLPTPPTNESNPFDYIGIEHNRALDNIISTYPKITKESYDKNWLSIVDTYMKAKGYDTKPFIDAHTSDKLIGRCTTQSWYTTSTPTDEINTFLSGGLISKTRYNEILKLYNTISSVDNLLIDFKGDASKTFDKIKNDIISLEASYKNMATDDANFCYIVSSVLRHSAFYWLNEGSKQYSAWDVPKTNSGGMLLSFSWRSLFGADAGGAVAGAVRVGVVGVLGGPAGWGAAGVAAVSTGIGSSCGNAIYQLFH